MFLIRSPGGANKIYQLQSEASGDIIKGEQFDRAIIMLAV